MKHLEEKDKGGKENKRRQWCVCVCVNPTNPRYTHVSHAHFPGTSPPPC